MTSYCTPRPPNASTMVLLPGESVESRLARDQAERQKAIKKQRYNRKRKTTRSSYKLGGE